jgi:2OG-Fe(II) oxygenase superfamily
MNSEIANETQAAARRRVRHADLNPAQHAEHASALDELYDDNLDLLSVRGAVGPEPLRRVVKRLDDGHAALHWSRPNEAMLVEDVHLLGSDAPATPTYRAPRGVSLDEYLASARTASGETYAPFTVRRMSAGCQIGIHHDYHYGLALYKELSAVLDTRTLISYVITLRKPDAGGELRVYGVTPTTPDAPKMPNGFQWDVQAIESRYDRLEINYDVGDLFLLASGRCLHSVARVEGPRSRITLGGFLALNRAHEQVLIWS